MKPKTLKDIEMTSLGYENVKAEAIKWVKECKFCMEVFKINGKFEPGLCCKKMVDFFNLTGEDLK